MLQKYILGQLDIKNIFLNIVSMHGIKTEELSHLQPPAFNISPPNNLLQLNYFNSFNFTGDLSIKNCFLLRNTEENTAEHNFY